MELKERDIVRLTWKQDMTLSEASFLIPSKRHIHLRVFVNLLLCFLVGQDAFSCIVIGRNTVALYKENDRPLEIESSLLDVICFSLNFH